MRRRQFYALTLLSLLLCVATVALRVHPYWIYDNLRVPHWFVAAVFALWPAVWLRQVNVLLIDNAAPAA